MTYNTILVAVIALLLVTVICLGYSVYPVLPQPAYVPRSTIPTPTDSSVTLYTNDYFGGTIATATDGGALIYTSSTYKFRFVYPQGWTVGDDPSGYGPLQLYNYDPLTLDGSSTFPKGKNKIELWILPNQQISDVTEHNVIINNRVFTKSDLIASSNHIRSYKTALPSDTRLSLVITMYGDSLSNFDIVDHVIKSLEWLK